MRRYICWMGAGLKVPLSKGATIANGRCAGHDQRNCTHCLMRARQVESSIVVIRTARTLSNWSIWLYRTLGLAEFQRRPFFASSVLAAIDVAFYTRHRRIVTKQGPHVDDKFQWFEIFQLFRHSHEERGVTHQPQWIVNYSFISPLFYSLTDLRSTSKSSSVEGIKLKVYSCLLFIFDKKWPRVEILALLWRVDSRSFVSLP